MTLINPAGVHFIPTHTGQQHYDFIRDVQPGILKIVGSGQVGTPDVQIMANCYEAAPNAIHIYRNQPLSEQHDALWADPVGTAIRHVQTLSDEMDLRIQQAKERKLQLPDREQVRILGINEPVLELFPRKDDMSNYDEWLAMVNSRSAKLDDYMSTFGQEADKHGWRAGLGNFSGGQPPNVKPGDYATYNWFPKTRKVIEASQRRHFLAVHEYWDIEGPQEMVNWWTYRWMSCDWDCDIAVLESGVDQQVRGDAYKGNRGWVGNLEPQAYVDQQGTYIRHCMTDSRFLCNTPFTLDGDKIWFSFYIEGCMPQMVDLSNHLRAEIAAQGNNPNTIHLPNIKAPNPGSPLGTTQPTGPTATPSTPAGANIRTGASTNFSILGAVPNGQPIQITGKADGDGGIWYRVDSPFGPGWVSSTVVSVANTESVPIVTAPAQPALPTPDGDWDRILAWLHKQEGGFQDFDWDAGNWTGCKVGVGDKKGTNFGISACAYPNLDIPNLVQAQADSIFFKDYYVRSEAYQLPWPANLFAMNAAVNFHPLTAKSWVAQSGGDPLRFYALMLAGYRHSDAWPQAGNAWVDRMIDLEAEANKP